jgi:hypothetical protein
MAAGDSDHRAGHKRTIAACESALKATIGLRQDV